MRIRRRKPTPPPQRVETITGLRASQEFLRARQATSQAGFTAERIPAKLFARRPILIDDGPEHLEHRKQLIRFFSPRTLEEKHRGFIEQTAADLVSEAQRDGRCRVDEVALIFSVRVASEIVGLTASATRARARRLEAFFRQPYVDHTRADHGRTQADWARAARDALLPLLGFYWRDVRPAIRARRRRPSDDVVSFLIARGYRPREILMECLTYGTAGMVTTREFISMALLWLLSDARLREQYLAAESGERLDLLAEFIRLEPPVAHLYRRVQAPAPGCPYEPGTLVDVDVRSANLDPEQFSPAPNEVCPDRGLPAAERTGVSFGDGSHRCPGSHLAMLETDVLLLALLRAGAKIEHEPERGFDTLVQGYQLRDFSVSFPPPADGP